MKIAMVSEHASPLAALGGEDAGGQNVFVAELSKRLVHRGHQVTVYTRSDSPSLPIEEHTVDGVTVKHIVAGPEEAIAKDEIFRYLGSFADGLAADLFLNPPDIVHAHFWMSGLASLDARLRSGVAAPIVQTFHALGHVKRKHQGDEDTSPQQRISLESYIATHVDAIIATCSDEVRELRELQTPRERTRVIPCGVDPEHFRLRTSTPSTRRVLSIGRLVPRKGVETVIRAVALLPGIELQIAGGSGGEWEKDPEVIRLRGIAEQLGISGRVHFLGPVQRDAVPELIASADVVAALPWYEPFGMVPLEAMACGVPVVGSAVGGLLDTVINGATGLLVPPRDHVTAAAAIGRLLANPRQAQAMGRAAAERVRERYTWNHVTDLTIDLYESLPSQPALPPDRSASVIDLREVGARA